VIKNRLRLALQKRRLSKESLSLLQGCGLKFRIKPNALLIHSVFHDNRLTINEVKYTLMEQKVEVRL
jgi:ATP phosphoribosyltransferase